MVPGSPYVGSRNLPATSKLTSTFPAGVCFNVKTPNEQGVSTGCTAGGAGHGAAVGRTMLSSVKLRSLYSGLGVRKVWRKFGTGGGFNGVRSIAMAVKAGVTAGL